ncbi:MAG: hypothetical protein R6V06_00915 [Kiritimatiellia bacterium]
MNCVKKSWGDYIRRRRSIQYRFRHSWFLHISSGIPWIDALIIIVLLLAVDNRLTIVPGMIFNLPEAPLRSGAYNTYNGLTAIMIPVVHNMTSRSETLVFFNDERFSMNDEDFAKRFSSRIQERIHVSSSHEMLLLADKNIPHGDVMRFVNVVREAGVNQVNVGEKPK